MDQNGHEITAQTPIAERTLRRMLRHQRIASAAVAKAQAENRRRGIPNWYSINGKIVSDLQIEQQQTTA
jgi:hypothetical protein